MKGARPFSLLRRVQLAVLLACCLSLLWIYFERARAHEQAWDSSLAKYVARAGARLDLLQTESAAADFGLGFSRLFLVYPYWNGSLPSQVEVWSRDGRRIWHDPQFAARPLTGGVPGHVSKIMLAGERYRILRYDGPRWSLRAVVHIHSIPAAMRSYLDSPFIRERIAISFLILLLPLWLIVRFGLAPLRQLAASLAQRPADDLSALGLNSRYRELQPLLAALDALLQQLRSKVQREHAFLQDAAHELRTPIAVIAAQSDILANAPTQEERELAQQHIKHAMARARHLLAQLDELARLDRAPELQLQYCDLAPLLQQDLAQFNAQAQARGMTLTLDSPAACWCWIEVASVQSVWLNFLSNALRYGATGGRIVVSLSPRMNGVVLSVADDGPGIAVAQRERVFERFYRGAGHDVAGAGLGLAIVQQAAQRLQGRLELGTGLDGRGCCFSIAIPIQQAPGTTPASAGADAAASWAAGTAVGTAVGTVAGATAGAVASSLPQPGPSYPQMCRADARCGLVAIRAWLKSRLKACLAPSFAPGMLRRLLWPVLLLNLLLWGAVFVQIVFQNVLLNTRARATQLQDAGQVLQQSATEQQAGLFAEAFMPSYEWYLGNPQFQERPNLLELWTRDGRRLFANRKGVNFDYGQLEGKAGQMTSELIHGMPYHLFRYDGARWSLRLGVAQVYGSPVQYLLDVARDPGFWWQLLCSSLLLWLVLWLALARALAPLHALAQRLAARGASDLSPLGLATPCRELTPIVAALEQVLQQLRQKIEREQGFIRDVGQKLRQPLDLMAAQVHVLVLPAPGADCHQAAQQIEQAVQQASHLIARLLEMARIDGLLAVAPEYIDLAQLLEAELAQRVAQAAASHIELSLDAPPSLCLWLERHALHAIVHNLLDNALRYGRPGGCVAVQLLKQPSKVILSVADDGPGIAPPERERVFQRFYQNPSKPGAAAGLGLAIVRQAAARLGGTVQLTEGLQGRGCRFTVTLALADKDKLNHA